MTILTEKKSVAENYSRALGLKEKENGLYTDINGNIKLTYAQGHLYTTFMPEDYREDLKTWTYKTLPFIPEKYRYKPDDSGESKKKVRRQCEKIIREAIRKGEEIVIATDPDREGEVIARLILESLKAPKERITRLWCNEGLSREEIVRAMKERVSDDRYDALARQGLCQKQSDWVLGINLTRAYTILNRTEKYSVGRVQTAVLKEIYRRQIEILSFVKTRYFEVEVQNESGTLSFLTRNYKTGKTRFDDEKTAKEIKERIESGNRTLKVKKADTESHTEKCPRLYDLAALQQDAYAIYAIGVERTLEVAQKLYSEEGVISYPRTDSVCMGEEDYPMVKSLYEKLSGIDGRFPEAKADNIREDNRRLFNSKEKNAHHGLIPSSFYEGKEGTDEKKIYDLILRRFLMQGMKDYRWEKTEVLLEDGDYQYEGRGIRVVEEGWHEAELRKKEREKLMDLKENEEVRIGKVSENEKWTEGPKPYNEGTIIAFMRNPTGDEKLEGVKLHSIGTEATQASIVGKLFDTGYIVNKGKHIEITEKGVKIVEQIKENRILDESTDVKTTTEWEEMGKTDPEKLLRKVEEVTRKSIGEIYGKMETEVMKTIIGKCLYCGNNVIKGPYGYYCRGNNEMHRISIPFHVYGNEMTDEIVKALFENGKTEMMEGCSKEGEKVVFRFVIREKLVKVEYQNDAEEVAACPKCGSGVMTMKKVYKCLNTRCDFFMWKQSSGITYTKDMVKRLCEGEKVATVQTKKDGSQVNVKVKLNTEKWVMNLEY